MRRLVELLVHAGAPSAARDDEQFRAQATAYLDFRGTRMGSSASNPEPEINPLRIYDERATTSKLRNSEHSFIEDSQLAMCALESQLVSSSFYRGRRGCQVVATANETNAPNLLSSTVLLSHSHDTPPYRSPSPEVATNDIVGESFDELSPGSYVRTPVFERSSKRQKIIHDVDCQTTDLAGKASVNMRQRLGGSMSPLNDLQRSQVQPGSRKASSELPSSYCLSEVTTESPTDKTSSSGCKDIPPEQALSPSSRQQDRSLEPSDEVSDGLRPTRKARVIVVANEPPKGSHLINESQRHDEADLLGDGHSDLPQNQNGADRGMYQYSVFDELPPRTEAPNSSPTCEMIKSIPTSIYPPEPAVDLCEFTSHMTQTLRYLVENLPETFKPLWVMRELDPLERGHWSVDLSTWPAQTQVQFWLFLKQTIESGSVGWGLWCTRTIDDASHRSIDRNGENSSVRQQGKTVSLVTLGRIKLYCWGEVVKHTYLMLYVGSKGQVRKLGLQWIDAAGVVVVQMRDA